MGDLSSLRGISLEEVVRWKTLGGRIDVKPSDSGTLENTWFSPAGVKVRTWREAQQVMALARPPSHYEPGHGIHGEEAGAARTHSPSGGVSANGGEDGAGARRAGTPPPPGARGGEEGVKRSRSTPGRPAAPSGQMDATWADARDAEGALALPQLGAHAQPEEEEDEEEGEDEMDEADEADEADEEDEEDEETEEPRAGMGAVNGPRSRKPNPRYFAAAEGVRDASRMLSALQGSARSARGWDEEGGEEEEGGEPLDPLGQPLFPPNATARPPARGAHRRGASAPALERVLVADDGGFVILTRGGRTLHHRPACLCKPCLARRRALEEGCATTSAPPREERPWLPPRPVGPAGLAYDAAVATAKMGGTPLFMTPGGGPGRGNKLCNGCGAVVRNGLRECPHCALPFLPLRHTGQGRQEEEPMVFGPSHVPRKRASCDADPAAAPRGQQPPPPQQARKEPRTQQQQAGGAAPAWGTHAPRRSAPAGGGGGGGGGAGARASPATGGAGGGTTYFPPTAITGDRAPAPAAAKPPSFAAPASGPLELWVRVALGNPDFEVVRLHGPRTLRTLEAACRDTLTSELPPSVPILYLRWLDNDARGAGRGATKLRSDTDLVALRVQDRIEVVTELPVAP